jgi:hypothetical protein
MLTRIPLMSPLTVPCPCIAQESSKMDLSLNVNGLFPRHAENNGLAQSASASAGVLASFRYSPSRFATFEFNYGHARDTQYFTNTGVQSSVHTGVHEVTGAYVLNLLGVPSASSPLRWWVLASCSSIPSVLARRSQEHSRRPNLLSFGARASTTTSRVISHSVCSTGVCFTPDLTSTWRP